MTQHRDFANLDLLPAGFLDALQQLLGTYASPTLRVTQGSQVQLRIDATTGDGQVGVTIGGQYRYNTAATTANAPAQSAGSYTIYVVSRANDTAQEDAGTFDYSFALKLSAPSGSGSEAISRSIGTYDWDGASITNFDVTVPWQLPQVIDYVALSNAQKVGSQQGVLLQGDFAVSAASASDINIAPGTAWVPNRLGHLLRVVNGGTQSVGAVPAAATARLDQIAVDARGIITRYGGSVDSGAVTLASRTGAAALSPGFMLLADVLVTSAGVLSANIRDRRPWGRGVLAVASRASDVTPAPTTAAAIDASALSLRVEAVSTLLRVRLRAGAIRNAAAGSAAYFEIGMMAAGATTTTVVAGTRRLSNTPSANYDMPVDFEWLLTVTPGSILLQPWWSMNVGGGTATLVASSPAQPIQFEVEEVLRPDTDNGVV